MSHTIYYADQTTGAYLGGISEGEPAPNNSIEVSTPPTFAFQVWTGSAWVPEYSPDPDSNGLLTDITFDIITAGGPWQMLQFYYPLSMQGTATTAEIDYMRKALWAILKADTSLTSTWLTSAYITKMETWAANRHMPLV